MIINFVNSALISNKITNYKKAFSSKLSFLPTGDLEFIELLEAKSISHLSAKFISNTVIVIQSIQFPSKEINLEFEITRTVQSTSIEVKSIEGIAVLFGYHFDLVFDSYFFNAKLVKDKIILRELLKTIMSCEIDLPLGDIKVTGADLDYYFDNDVITIDVATKEKIDILGNNKFNISEVGFHVQLWDGELKVTKLEGICVISDVTFNVSGTFEKDNGFTFEFSLADHKYDSKDPNAENNIDLTGFFKALDISVKLPKIDISGLEFSFNSRTKDVHFKIECEWEMPKQLKNKPEFEITAYVSSKTNKINVKPKVSDSVRYLTNKETPYNPESYQPNDGDTIIGVQTTEGEKHKSNVLLVSVSDKNEVNISNPSSHKTNKAYLDLFTSLSKTGSPTHWTIGTEVYINDSRLALEMHHEAGENSYAFSGRDLKINLGSLLSDVFNKIKIPSGDNSGSAFDSIFNDFQEGLDKFTVQSFSINHGPTCNDLQLQIKSELHFSDLLKALGAGNPLKNYDFKPSITELDLSYSSSGSGESKIKQYSISCYLSTKKSSPASLIFKASSVSQGKGDSEVKGLIGNIYSIDGKGIDLGNKFPIKTTIEDLFLAHITLNPENEIKLFGTDFSVRGDVDLSKLEVVGQFLNEAKFSFDAIRVVHTDNSIKADDLEAVNEYLAKLNIAPLVVKESTKANNSKSPAKFPAGFSLQGTLKIGDEAKTIPLFSNFSKSKAKKEVDNKDDSKSEEAQIDPSKAISEDSPSPVGKKFGPLSINSVSIGLASGGKLMLTFNAALQIGPLQVEMIEMNLKSPLTKFSPEIGLHGLGFSFDKPPLEMSGLFLKSTVEIPTENKDEPISLEAYSGSLSIGYKDYSLMIMGSYAKLPDGVTSIFIYGFLAAPLAGVPGILMITGVALGMGYNRRIPLPKAIDIKTYPLVQAVLDPKEPVDFDKMNLNFLPKEGAFWGAIGLKLEAFNMIDAFVLLILNFGSEFEIDILGVAEMSFPKPAEGSNEIAIAKFVIGVEARILPERGILSVTGAFLPGTYIYNPKAIITGDFAFLSVFKDQDNGAWEGAKEGDFILTIGGYHPDYKPKAYYPKASRIEMNWKVSDNLSVKSSAYFAIAPDAMMIGGHMVADYRQGGTFAIAVHFEMGADFLIYWKPFHYQGHAHAELKVNASINLDCWLFTIHQSVDFDLSADLRIWGPEFSGHASVSVHVLVSFTVGISFGAPEKVTNPLKWEEFKTSFLPYDKNSVDKDKILSISIGRGLMDNYQTPNHKDPKAPNIVNAKELTIICETAIPIKEISGVKGVDGIVIKNDTFGIKSMALMKEDFNSTLDITITGPGDSSNFIFEPIYKNLPAALWQPAITKDVIPDRDENSLIEDLLTGIKITAKEPKKSEPAIIKSNKPDFIRSANSSYSKDFVYDKKYSRNKEYAYNEHS